MNTEINESSVDDALLADGARPATRLKGPWLGGARSAAKKGAHSGSGRQSKVYGTYRRRLTPEKNCSKLCLLVRQNRKLKSFWPWQKGPKEDNQCAGAMLVVQSACPTFGVTVKSEPVRLSIGSRHHVQSGATDKVAPQSVVSNSAHETQRSTTTFPTVFPSARCAWAAATSSKRKLCLSTTGLTCPASTISARVLKMSP